ncbi:hypothetical protein pb186bvf_017453 [Paramecium bursaria]
MGACGTKRQTIKSQSQTQNQSQILKVEFEQKKAVQPQNIDEPPLSLDLEAFDSQKSIRQLEDIDQQENTEEKIPKPLGTINFLNTGCKVLQQRNENDVQLEKKAQSFNISVAQYYNKKCLDVKDNQQFKIQSNGFSAVGFPDEDIDQQAIFQILQPGFIFEVIVIEKTTKLEILVLRFLSFCDQCQSNSLNYHQANFNLFKNNKRILGVLDKINTMKIRGTIEDFEVVCFINKTKKVEDFSIFTYYINFDKIQVGDHLNAVLINENLMAFSLKNKHIMNGKQWSLQNLQDPTSFDNKLFVRLGYSRVGLQFQYNQLKQSDQQKEEDNLNDNLRYKEQTGILKLDYQIKNDVGFLNKSNYNSMLKALNIEQRSSLTDCNIKSVLLMNLNHRRLKYIQQLGYLIRVLSNNRSVILKADINKYYLKQHINIILIFQKNKKMAKQGWGFSGNTVKLDTNNKVEKKLNIWEKAGEANDIQFIPDADEESKPQNQVSDAGQLQGQKLQNISELQTLTRITSLPPPPDDIDLSVLTQVLRPYEEIAEMDESWEFQKLKTEMQEIVSKLYNQQK